MSDSYKEVNRKSWNNRVVHHVKSEFYDQASFEKGKSSLNTIELGILGEVKGLKILHLQCHFGQDTLSLARMGAEVTGVDISDKAISEAKRISDEIGVKARFICSDVYDLPTVIDEKFDIIYTSYGVIGWLPDMNKWGEVIDTFLKPKGKFLLVEFHPFVWMFDDKFENITYAYHNSGEIIEEESGTYAELTAPIKDEFVNWNHSLSEVMTGIINNGLEIKSFKEYNYSPYNCFLGCEKLADRKYQIKKFGNKMPLIYSLLAEKK